MLASSTILLRVLLFLLLLIPSNTRTCLLKKKKNKWPCPYEEISLGANIDITSRAGKEEMVAMDLAKKDFFTHLCDSLSLHVENSSGDPLQAVTSAKILVKKYHARVVVGLGKWQEAASVAEFANNSKVPFISLANEDCSDWPFVVYAARSQFSQMKAIAAMIRSWQWRKVSIIYEDDNAALTCMIPYLMDALGEINTEINDIVPLTVLVHRYSLHGKLKHLKNGQCKVFIVHTSITLAKSIFKEARNLGMVEKEFVWITTSSFTNVVDSLDGSIISSMQGVLGVKSYFSRSGKQFKHFRSRFQALFHEQYPEETHSEPGIHALQAYDALRAVAAAMGGFSDNWKHLPNSTDDDPMVSLSGQKLLNRILKANFEGLTGAFHFKEGKLVPAHVYRIVNIVGITCKELGYWTEGLGFSVRTGRGSTYDESMRVLGHVLWPGVSWSLPSDLAVAKSAKQPLRIGVPSGNSHVEFVNVRQNPGGHNFTGFSIEVFKRIVDHHKLPYEFIPFNGNYNSLVKQVSLKEFDAVVGDTAIIANRCQYVEFSQPYAEQGVQMLVYVKHRGSGGALLFKEPFTTDMWAATGAIVLYNGFVVWLIERKHNPQFTTGSKLNQAGCMVSLAFNTLFSLHGEKLHSNLSRMTMVVWLFVALIITSSYTASLTSLLTHQRLGQDIPSVETLIRNGAKVGCDGDSFVAEYLEKGVGFDSSNIQGIYSEDEYYGNLTGGHIAAAFLEVPYVKVFRAKHCNNFTTGPITYPVGGFGFAFPKNSEYLPDISQAILKLSEEGELRKLEESMRYNCSDLENESDQDSLALPSFKVLFFVTVGTSTVALVIFIINSVPQHRLWHSKIVGPQPANTEADESLAWQRTPVDELLPPRQSHANEQHWLSAWERENQGG